MKHSGLIGSASLPALVAGSILSLLTVAADAAPLYRITIIPSLPLGERCAPVAINDLGNIAGNCAQHGFFWTPEEGPIEITPQAGYLTVRALNNHDVVAAHVTAFNGSHRDGVLWDRSNGLRVFTPDGDFGVIGEVQAINDAGKVVGAGWVPTAGHAFTWTEASGMVDPLPDVRAATQARDINSLGQMVGWGTGERGDRSVIMDPDGQWRLLDASFCGTGSSAVYGLNDLGQVAGSCYATSNSLHAVVWAGPHHGRDIDRRAEGKGMSQAFEVNNAGQVVGSWTGSGPDGQAWETAFYWDPTTRMTGLDRLLDPTDPLAAVTRLGPVVALNQAGQIASAGFVDGQWQMVLLTPTTAIAPAIR
jgi:probable HAF family extracellular repeat protein